MLLGRQSLGSTGSSARGARRSSTARATAGKYCQKVRSSPLRLRPRLGSNPKAPVGELPSPWRTDERLAVQAEARRFAIEKVLPLANRLDPVKGEMPRSFLDRVGEQGYFGIMIPAEYGGMGLGVFEYCMIAEELAGAWMSVASIIARAQGMGTQFGDSANRRERRERSARGAWIGGAAFSEPGAGSDLASVGTRAVPDGEEWVITGEKRWTGFG